MIRSLVLVLTLAAAGAASAHAKKEGTIPADGATVAAVPELGLSFDSPMRVVTIALTLDGAPVRIERMTGTEPVTVFRASPAAPLAPGAYRVEWRGMAEDGHPMQGGFGFTVTE